jgi:hypothetical protein
MRASRIIDELDRTLEKKTSATLDDCLRRNESDCSLNMEAESMDEGVNNVNPMTSTLNNTQESRSERI